MSRVLLDPRDLTPRALAVFQRALEAGAISAARDLLFGLGFLRRKPLDAQTDQVDVLEEQRLQRAIRPQESPASVASPSHRVSRPAHRRC